MPEYNIYPAVDENYNFPPQIKQTIVSYPEILDTQGRVDEAERKLVENEKQLAAAKAVVAAAAEDLRILEEVELPAAVEKLEQADQKAAEDLGVLDTNLETARQELADTEASIDTLKNVTLPTMRQELDAADAQAQQDFTELEGRLSSIDTPNSGALSQIREALTAAETVATNAKTAADTANQAANAASQAALEAAGIAASKGRVIIQATEPMGVDRNAANIWIQPVEDDPETEVQERATTYVYLEASDEWVPTTSDELAQAAQNALDAREAAQQAQQRAETAISNAAAAQSTAEAAQRTADQATLEARDAWNAAIDADDKAKAAIQRGDSLIANGSFELGDANWPSHPGRYEIVESATARTGTHVMRLTPEGGNAYPVPDMVGIGAGRVFRARAWFKYLGGNGDSRVALYYRLFNSVGQQVFASYAGYPTRVYVFPKDMPVGTWILVDGDINIPSDVTDPSIVTHLTVAPHALNSTTDKFDVDDIQVIDITEAYAARARADEAYAEAERKLDSDQVQGIVDDARGEITSEIRSSANGKNSITISYNEPSGNGVIAGDTWWRVDSNNQIFAQWVWSTAGAWAPRTIRSEVIANLDVHKLIGTDGEFETFFAKKLTANDAAVEKLWTDQLVGRSATLNRLIVSPANMIPDPQGRDPQISAHRNFVSAGFTISSAGYWRKSANTLGNNSLRLDTSTDTYGKTSPLIPGQRYTLTYEAWISSGTAGARWAIRYTKIDGTIAYVGDEIEPGGDAETYNNITSGAWHTVTRYWDAPSNAVSASFDPQINLVDTATDIRVRNPVVRPQVSSVLIENGAVKAEQVNAESVAGAVGKFVEAEVGKLKATEGTIGTAVINKLWAEGIASKSLTTSQLTVSPSNMLASIQTWGLSTFDRDTDPWRSFGRNASDPSRWTQGPSTYLVNQPIEFVKGQKYRLTFDAKASISGTRFYLQLTNAEMDGSEANGSFFSYVDGASVSNSYLISDQTIAGSGTWNTYTVEFEPEASGLAMLKWYMNHSRGTSTSTTYQWIRSPSLRAMSSSVLIENGAITTPKLTVTQDMAARIAQFMSVATKELIVTGGATINNAKLIGDTWVENLTSSKIIGNNGIFTGTVDAANINGGSFTGKTFTGGTFTGARLNAVDSAGYGLAIIPKTYADNAAIFFTDDGSLSNSQAAVWRNGYTKGAPAELMLRGGHGADVRIQDTLYVNKVMKAQSIESRANLTVDGNTNINRNLYVGGRATGANDGSVFATNVDSYDYYVRDSLNTGGSARIQSYGRFDQHGSSMYFHNLPSGSSSGNVVVNNSDRRVYQNFSSRRFKKNIVDWSPTPESVLALQPRQWQHHDPKQPDNPNNFSEVWNVGFIAEEVDDLGLTGLVQYGSDGEGGMRPDSLNYDRFPAAQQIVLRKHEEEISTLQLENESLRAENDGLKTRLDDLEATVAQLVALSNQNGSN